MGLLARLARHGWLFLPILVGFGVFSAGFGAWFQQDDFAHLQLAARTPLAELPAMMLQPIAQGTFRPLSERLFYWAPYWAFGLDAWPFRVMAYLAQAANLLLAGLLLRRLTGSRVAAVVGCVVWAVNPNLTLSMTWIAATNQLLWTGCLLGAVLGFVRYADGGGWRWLAGSWGAYLLGFGMLETNVAAAAVIGLFVLLYWPSKWRQAAWYWLPAVTFAVGHMVLIPKAGGGTYGLRLGWDVLGTIGTYWQWSWLLDWAVADLGLPAGLGVGYGLLMAGLAGWLVWAQDSRRAALFGLGWWLLALGPVLPLHGHVSDYYLTAPLVGLAVMVAAGWRLAPRVAVVVLLVYVGFNVPIARRYAFRNVAKSLDMRALVLGVGQIHEADRDAGRTILLAGIGDELFWSGVYDRPFSLVGAKRVYLTPETAARLTPVPELFQAARYTVPEWLAALLVREGSAKVYAFGERRLRNVTAAYKIATAGVVAPTTAKRVELGDVSSSAFLGPEWHGREEGFRWMPGRATVRLKGAGSAVVLTGFCKAEQVHGSPFLTVSAEWDGVGLGEQQVTGCPRDFELRFALPAGRSTAGVLQLGVRPVLHFPGDPRELGLAVVAVEVR